MVSDAEKLASTELDANVSLRTVDAGRWQATASIGRSMLRYVAIVAMASQVTPDDYAVVALSTTLFLFANILVEVFPAALVRLPALTERDIRASFTSTMMLSVLVGAALILLAPTIANIFNDDRLAGALRLVGLTFPAQAFGASSIAVLQRDLEFRELMRIELIAVTVGYAGIGLPLAFFGFSYWAFLWAFFANALLKSLLAYRAEQHTLRLGFPSPETRVVARFGTNLMMSRVFHVGGREADKLILSSRLGVAALGPYEMAYKMMRLPVNIIIQVTNRVMYPTMARLAANAGPLDRSYLTTVSLAQTLLLPVAAFFFVLFDLIVDVTLGPEWEQTVLVGRILLLGTAFTTLTSVCDTLTRAVDAVAQGMRRKLIFALLVVVFTSVGAGWGSTGIAVGAVAASVVVAALMVQLVISLVPQLTLRRVAASLLDPIRLAAVAALTIALCRYVATIFLDNTIAVLLATTAGSVILGGGLALAIPRATWQRWSRSSEASRPTRRRRAPHLGKNAGSLIELKPIRLSARR